MKLLGANDDLASGYRYRRNLHGPGCTRRSEWSHTFAQGAFDSRRSFDGFIEGIDEIRAVARISPAEISRVFHGTTVATSAILERKYDVLGLIVTGGYREVLECARQTVPGEFGDITTRIKPPRVVPLELVRETTARMDVAGREVRPMQPDQIREFAREFKRLGVRAIAVSLLQSYRNPSHEEHVRDLIAEVYPECRISISSEILSEYREYERKNNPRLRRH